MSRTDFFRTPEAKRGIACLDRSSGYGFRRERVFSDWLTVIVCELAAGTDETTYLEAVKLYSSHPRFRDAIYPSWVEAAAIVITAESYSDVLGDMFEGGISWGENGQYFTPPDLCGLMAAMMAPASGESVNDCACGSGRLLLAAAKQAGGRAYNMQFTGSDCDGRCAQIAAVNLAVSGLRGEVHHENTLTLERRATYQIGPFSNGSRRGLIRITR